MTTQHMADLGNLLDSAALELLGELRASKTLETRALARVISAIDGLGAVLAHEQEVPRELVGRLWFIFTAMLAEADHARDVGGREKIQVAAWDVAERLRKIFGPSFR